MVEAQHIASTMKLVQGRDEQDLLESLLEHSKPALHALFKNIDYLLITPFRYPTRSHGSRFRSPTDPGVFYAAESERTAGAELGYWRWKFLMDSPALEQLAPNAHTAFQTRIKALTVDIRQPRFAKKRSALLHPAEYSAAQAFARELRSVRVEAILYPSVRDPEPGWCIALFTPNGFSNPKPQPASYTWFLSVTRDEATWRRDAESMTFSASLWHSNSSEQNK